MPAASSRFVAKCASPTFQKVLMVTRSSAIGSPDSSKVRSTGRPPDAAPTGATSVELRLILQCHRVLYHGQGAAQRLGAMAGCDTESGLACGGAALLRALATEGQQTLRFKFPAGQEKREFSDFLAPAIPFRRGGLGDRRAQQGLFDGSPQRPDQRLAYPEGNAAGRKNEVDPFRTRGSSDPRTFPHTTLGVRTNLPSFLPAPTISANGLCWCRCWRRSFHVTPRR